MPTKSEPDYTDEIREVESGDHEATYVEDDSYGEMRYDESYFTENEDAAGNATTVVTGGNAGSSVATTSKAMVKQQGGASFSDGSFVDVNEQANTDAQGLLSIPYGAKQSQGLFCADILYNDSGGSEKAKCC